MADKTDYSAVQNLRTLLSDSVGLGKNPFDIILEMAKILGEISGEKNYYQSIRDQIGAIYGLSLNDKFVLQKKIEEISERIKKIETAYKDESFDADEHDRIGFALDRHKAELNRLRELKGSESG